MKKKKITYNPRDVVVNISWGVFFFWFGHGCDVVVCGVLVAIPRHHCYDGWVKMMV